MHHKIFYGPTVLSQIRTFSVLLFHGCDLKAIRLFVEEKLAIKTSNIEIAVAKR